MLILPLWGLAQSSASPDTVCAGDQAVPYWVTGTTGSTYAWTVNGTYGSITYGNGTDSINIDWGLTTGLVNSAITVTETDSNGCVGDPVALDVFISPVPVADAGSDNDTCGQTYILDAVASVGTGTWTSSDPSAIFTNANSATSSVTVSSYGAINFYWTENNNGCIDADTVVITFIEIPVVDAGPAANVCALSHTLAASANVGTGTWTTDSTGVTFSNVYATNSNVTVPAYGDYKFYWTVVNSGCESIDSVVISFYEQPVADAGLDTNVCGLSLNLNANPSVGTGTWTSSDPSASFGNVNDPNTSVSVSGYGTVNFTWTENNGGCTDADVVVVNFINMPPASAGGDEDTCGLSYALTGSSVGAGSGLWTSSDPSAVFVDATSPNTSVSVSNYGAVTFTWTVSQSGCSSADDVVINFLEQPIANAGADDDLCGTSYTLSGSQNVGSGVWTANTGSVTFSSTTDPNATVTVPAAGVTVIFTWTVTNGSCDDADDVTIIFNNPPTTSPIMHN